MKNKLKLLSILPTAAVISSASFAVSSCHSNYVEPIYTTKITEDYDDPSIEPCKDEFVLYNQTEITNLYSSFIAEDDMFFPKDMTCGAARKYKEFAEVFLNERHPLNPGADGSTLDNCEFGFSKPTFGTTKVWEMGFEDKDYTTISFKQRVNLSYSKTTDEYKIVKNMSLDISYTDVIFLISESNYDNPIKTPNWNVGILDPWFKDESFWIYQYNTKPWSINYGLSFDITKTIFGEPNIDIHKCSYYSGNIVNANQLYNLWVHWQNIDAYQDISSEITCDDILEAQLIKCILCFEYGSKKIMNLVNKPDVCVIDQLNGEYDASSPTQYLHKIDFIFPKDKSYRPEDITISLNYTEEELPDDLVCDCVTDPSKKLVIARNAVLELDESVVHTDASASYKLPITIEGGTMVAPEVASFNVPFRSLKILITFSAGKQVETELFLHYNTFVLSCLE